MPSDKERMAAKRAGIAAWNSGGPGGGNTFPLEFAIDAAIDALSAAGKEREGERPEAICDTCGSPKGLQVVGESCNGNCGGRVIPNPAGRGEGDIIEKLREWAKAEHDATVGWDAMGTRAVTLLLARLDTFLNDLQEQSTEGDGTSPGEET